MIRYLFENNSCGLTGIKEVRIFLLHQRIRAALFSWYSARKRRLKSYYDITELEDVYVGVFGGDTSYLVKTKAKQSHGFVIFLVEHFLPSLAARITPAFYAQLLRCGQVILDYLQLVKVSPRQPSDATMQEMFDLGMEHLRLCRVINVPWSPKHHLFIHMMHRTQLCGNPREYATFQDESLNKVLSAVSKTAHAAVWEKRIFSWWRQLPIDKRSGF